MSAKFSPFYFTSHLQTQSRIWQSLAWIIMASLIWSLDFWKLKLFICLYSAFKVHERAYGPYTAELLGLLPYFPWTSSLLLPASSKFHGHSIPRALLASQSIALTCLFALSSQPCSSPASHLDAHSSTHYSSIPRPSPKVCPNFVMMPSTHSVFSHFSLSNFWL